MLGEKPHITPKSSKTRKDLKPFFKNGVLSEKPESVIPGFINAFSYGLIRYAGDSRTAKSGAERPLSVLIETDNSNNSEKIHKYFKDAFLENGVEAGKNLTEFDLKIEIRAKKMVEIEVFESENEKLFPIPQLAVNYIEHSLNTETGL